MNYKVMAENLGLEEDEFYEMMTLFIEVSRSDLDRWAAAVERNEAVEIASAAHSIKGAASNLGFEEIAEVSLEVETKAEHNDLTGAPEAMVKVKGMLDALEQTVGA